MCVCYACGYPWGTGAVSQSFEVQISWYHSHFHFILPLIFSHTPSFSPLSLFLPPSRSFYRTSLFHMLTVWLGIFWPPGSLNQSRGSLTESARTCPDRNDNDHGQSPPVCRVATVISLFWNAHGGIWGEALHLESCVNSESVWEEKKISFNFTYGLKYA